MSNTKTSHIFIRHANGQEVPLIEIHERPLAQPEFMPSSVIDAPATYLPEYYYRKEPFSTSLLAGIGAFALASLIGGLGLIAKSTEAQPLNSATSVTSNENSATSSAEIQASNSAQAEARLITEHINSNINGDVSHLKVTLVNGVILKNTATPNTGIAVYEPIVQDAILLSTVSNQTPDTNGKFLNGAWLGVIGPKDALDTPMKVEIMQFDSKSMRFQANGEPTIVASILTSPVNLVGVGIAHETMAFDTSSLAQLYNGSRPVYAGEDLTR